MQTTMPRECGTTGIDGIVWCANAPISRQLGVPQRLLYFMTPAAPPQRVWAPGSGYYATPPNAGIKFGRNTSVTGIAVELHYSALDGFPANTTDYSSFVMCAPPYKLSSALSV